MHLRGLCLRGQAWRALSAAVGAAGEASASGLQCRASEVLLGAPRGAHTAAASTYSAPIDYSSKPDGPPAFVFDIDGVLVRGKSVLPPALEAVRKLTTPAGAWRYPVVFVTNGGGVTEASKAAQLAGWLGVPVAPSQVVLSHTPMRDLVPELGDKPVLVSGRGDALSVAHGYGFTKAFSTLQLGRTSPSATPFCTYPKTSPAGVAPVCDPIGDAFTSPSPPTSSPSPYPVSSSSSSSLPTQPAAAAAAAAPAPEPCPVRDLGYGSEAHPIAAVLVMTDPADWYRDLQLIIDVVTGHGVPARPTPLYTGPNPVKIYFSNPDLLWANDYPKNRFGQGAFIHIVNSLYERMTQQPLPNVRIFGKPNPEPYHLAERLLVQQARDMGLIAPGGTPDDSSSGGAGLPFSHIFAVGDNPAADIRGARAAGPPWVPVLVRTGVFQGPADNCTIDPASIVVDHVADAVQAALHHARNAKWHSMR